MPSSVNVDLQLFLVDAIRLCEKAEDLVRDFSPGACEQLYQVIHTIKGTALMVESARPVAQMLHDLETRFESLSKRQWRSLARAVLSRVRRNLIELDERQKMSSGQEPKPGNGLFVRLSNNELQWYALSLVVRVLTCEEFSNLPAVSVDGLLVPVNVGQGKFGLVLRTDSGLVLEPVTEILGLVEWWKAKKIIHRDCEQVQLKVA